MQAERDGKTGDKHKSSTARKRASAQPTLLSPKHAAITPLASAAPAHSPSPSLGHLGPWAHCDRRPERDQTTHTRARWGAYGSLVATHSWFLLCFPPFTQTRLSVPLSPCSSFPPPLLPFVPQPRRHRRHEFGRDSDELRQHSGHLDLRRHCTVPLRAERGEESINTDSKEGKQERNNTQQLCHAARLLIEAQKTPLTKPVQRTTLPASPFVDRDCLACCSC